MSRPSSSRMRVRVREQGDLLEEAIERGPSSARGVVLLAHLDQLLEVLDPPLGLDRALGLQRLDVAGAGEHLLEHLPDAGSRLGEVAKARHRLHEPGERLDGRGPRPRYLFRRGRHLEHGLAGRVRVGDHSRQRRLPDPASRRVGDAGERHRVLRVEQDGQISHRVLDLGPVVELRPADDLVGDLLADQPVLEHPRLRVGPVEDGDLLAGHALVHEALHLPRDEPRLRVLVVELADLHGIALAELGEERLAHAPAVVGDDGVGRVEDRLRRAVVLLQADDVGVCVVVLEVQDISNVRSAEHVDRLIFIATTHRRAPGPRRPRPARQQLQHPVLRVVRVLVLVDEDVAEGGLVALADLGEQLEHVDRAEEQVVEVHRVGAVDLALVQLVDVGDRLLEVGPDELAVVLGRAQLVLGVGDLGLDRRRREALRVDVEVADALADQAARIGLVVDRELRV